jgi:hypothetical protein
MTITPESLYQFQERLGILCGDAKPTREQYDIARRQVEDLELSYGPSVRRPCEMPTFEQLSQ